MPTVKFALEEKGPKRVEITFEPGWRDVRVSCDGTSIGRIPNAEGLRLGDRFPLPGDLGILGVQLTRGWVLPILKVTRNGRPLPGSPADPKVRIRVTSNIFLLIAALDFFFAVTRLVGDHGTEQATKPWFSFALGAIYLGAGIFTRRGSMLAVVVGLGLYALETLASALLPLYSAQPSSIGWTLLRVVFIASMARTFAALRESRRQAELADASKAF